jgi:DNA-binding FrmR family transcriptional regulator
VEDDVMRRLVTARGHLDAVVRMAESDEYCLDVLHQLSAIQGALDRVRRVLLERHLRDCLPQVLASGEFDDVVDELVTAAFGGPIRRSRPADDVGVMDQNSSSR